MATSTIFDFLDSIETGLQAAMPSGVTVYTTPEDISAGPTTDLVLLGWKVESEQEHAAMSGVRKEAYTCPGEVFVSRPINSEAGSKAARERVEAIVDAIEDYLRANTMIGNTVHNAHITQLNIEQGPFGQNKVIGRYCMAEFTISAVTHI